MNKKNIIINNHKVYNDKFCNILEMKNFKINYIFQSPKHALNYLSNNLVDIIFIDIIMPETYGIDLIKKIKTTSPFCKVILLNMNNDKNIISKELLNNLDGYYTNHHSDEEIKGGIDSSFLNIKKDIVIVERKQLIKDECLINFKLTKREKEIIDHILCQKSNFEIAEKLFISKRTVETHRKNIIDKLKVKNSIGIAVKVLQAQYPLEIE